MPRSIYRLPPTIPRPRVRMFVGRGTRFYFPSSGAAAVSPGYSANWEDTSIASRLKTVTAKSSTAMTTVSFTDLLSTDEDVLFRQWVSDPLTAQTISGQYVQMQMRVVETLAINNMFLTWLVKVVSNDGTTIRGTMIDVTRDDVEADTALTNRRQVLPVISLNILDGDRLVFEIGTGGVPTASVHDSSLRIGDTGATDLAEDDTTTADDVPWLEFQQPLTFQVGGRTTKNTRAFPLGQFVATGWRMPVPS